MGVIKNRFHDEICWNALDESEKQDALYYASCDTQPKAGDVQQAPLVSGAVRDSADAPRTQP